MTIFRQIPNNSMVKVTFLAEKVTPCTGLLRMADEYGFTLIKENKLNFIPWSAVALVTLEPGSKDKESVEEN